MLFVVNKLEDKQKAGAARESGSRRRKEQNHGPKPCVLKSRGQWSGAGDSVEQGLSE